MQVFTEHTHIVAIRTSGNVYCQEAIEQLCIKPKNLRDLLTDEPFTRKDIIQIQDPLNTSCRTIDNFDHVARNLSAEVPEDPASSSSIRNSTQDMQRALGALQTAEAKAAFERGGGGKRAEAQRMLLDAKAAAVKVSDGVKAAAAAATAGSGGVAAAAAAAAAAADAAAAATAAGGGDWRLRAPARKELNPAFKAGAATWDTDDYRDPVALAGGGKSGKKKVAAAEAVAASKAAAKVGKLTPKERYEAEGHVRYAESFHTTGAASRSFTSTTMEATTKNARTLVVQHRDPTKKG